MDTSLDSLPLVCETKNAVPGHEPSLLPPGREWTLAWNDEFDGDRLDEAKWRFRTNFWGRRAHWFAAPEDGVPLWISRPPLRSPLLPRPQGR